MVPIADSVARYAVDLVRATRATDPSAPDFVKKYVNFGASVRAAQFLVLAAKARALMHHRYHVTYEDVIALMRPILRHRILLNFQAESDRLTQDDILKKLLEAMPAPESVTESDVAAISRSDGAGRHFRPRPGGQDRGGRLHCGPAPVARFRIQPGVRRVSRLLLPATICATWIGTYSPARSAMYLKRYRGETNCQLTILLDASRSMKYSSHTDREAGVCAISGGLARVSGAACSATRRG